MKTCCICQTQTESKPSRWATCKKMSCKAEAKKQKMAEQNKRTEKNKLNPTPKRLRNIARMRDELDTREAFAKAVVVHGESRNLAQKYKVNLRDVSALRIELFGEMNPYEIHKLGRELLAAEKPKIKTKERWSNPVIVYEITDREAFERARADYYLGLPARNDGLEYVRTERAEPRGMPFNWEFADKRRP